MARAPLNLWNHWATQILLLLSLALQIVLSVFAGIRRRQSSSMPRILLWLAYLLADSTAIYAIGHLSLSSAPSNHHLVAFWSPFLLLHLGGPDNITAYALQDNQLWLRHLQTLVVQVLGAAYVLYKHIAGNGNFLVLAATLMFTVGAVKYGERTWALKCSNLDSIRSSLKKERPTRHNHFHPQDQAGDHQDEEFVLRRAHSLFHICKRAIVDSSVDGDSEYRDTTEMLGKIDMIWGLMEMELSLMYDILYTKAAVIHTWFGYCLRVISPLAIVASLLLFQFSSKVGHSRVDIAITYVLLCSALFMETTSLLNAVGSTWAFAFLCTTSWSWLRYEALCTARWDRLRRAVASLHRLIKATTGGGSSYRSERWTGTRTLGQYNMLHFCTRRDNNLASPLLGRLAKMVGLGEWWNRKHYSGSIEISELVKEHTIKHMARLYKKGRWNALGVLRKKWGQEALEQNKSFPELEEFLGVEFQEGVIIWHIATDVFLIKSERARVEGASGRVEAIKVMSNYMVFLLVERPYMLPGLAQNRLYQRTCENLVEMRAAPNHRKWDIWEVLRSLFSLRDDPDSNSKAVDVEKLAKILYDKNPSFSIDAPRLSYVTRLARRLVEKEADGTTDSLQLVLEVWTDILVYAGNKCSRESHAKKLNSGGEFTTILWLMAEHLFQASLEGP
ncbi:uncharacterized protein LOC119357390 [Triticum dicoccoides]|uniref:uncharacterized protein LOC119357390 n=1 Tax=Triticum dicoccoides TaxID=85692 RepID=UPI000E7B2CB1|nr:uncharacterized protein LOC119357390 [Triticum dicoccoides]